MIYKVESNAYWFLVDCPNPISARLQGVLEWGKGLTTSITKASKEDIEYFKNLKGIDAIEKV